MSPKDPTEDPCSALVYLSSIMTGSAISHATQFSSLAHHIYSAPPTRGRPNRADVRWPALALCVTQGEHIML